jgi:hypothetical protein
MEQGAWNKAALFALKVKKQSRFEAVSPIILERFPVLYAFGKSK